MLPDGLSLGGCLDAVGQISDRLPGPLDPFLRETVRAIHGLLPLDFGVFTWVWPALIGGILGAAVALRAKRLRPSEGELPLERKTA